MAGQAGLFACRKCRLRLFREEDIEEHGSGPGQTNFTHKKRDRNTDEVNCNSWFLADRMEWMGPLEEVDGKLACPKCQSRVGSYSWVGAQCSCGHWCNPALQVTKSRVDKTHVQPAHAIRQVPAAALMRQPPAAQQAPQAEAAEAPVQ